MFVLEVLYLFIPAIIANTSPGIAASLRLPGDIPIAASVLGKHKTWRGHIASFFGGMMAAYVLHIIAVLSNGAWVTAWYEDKWMTLAVLMTVGAKLGDTIKSGIKRRFQKKEGAPWYPLDQIDYMIGAILFTMPVTGWIGWKEYAVLIIVPMVANKPIAILAHRFGQKRVPW